MLNNIQYKILLCATELHYYDVKDDYSWCGKDYVKTMKILVDGLKRNNLRIIDEMKYYIEESLYCDESILLYMIDNDVIDAQEEEKYALELERLKQDLRDDTV